MKINLIDTDMNIVSSCIGKPFPEERYISSNDCVMPRITPHSFDIVITLKNISIEERRAIANDSFSVSIFVFKQIPYIVFDFGVYKCNIAINIQKIRQVPVEQWIKDEEETVILYLLEESTGKIMDIRFCKFPLMTELKYLLNLQSKITKETIDSRIAEGESMYSVHDMLNYSIFFGEVSASENIFESQDAEEEYLF
ncbi:MAG: hypothetical protein UH625_10605 [Muribaculaceae bacterium]|nr:hypothetical protein [Muribaculaceae bacterium]